MLADFFTINKNSPNIDLPALQEKKPDSNSIPLMVAKGQ